MRVDTFSDGTWIKDDEFGAEALIDWELWERVVV